MRYYLNTYFVLIFHLFAFNEYLNLKYKSSVEKPCI
jgi:hypothetical protein